MRTSLRGTHAAGFSPLGRVRFGLRSSPSLSFASARKSSSSELPGSARLLCAAPVSLALRRRGASSGASRATLRLRRVLQSEQQPQFANYTTNSPQLVCAAEVTPGVADQAGGHLQQARSCVTHLGCASEASSSAGWSATACLASPDAALSLRAERRAAGMGLRTSARLALRDQPVNFRIPCSC